MKTYNLGIIGAGMYAKVLMRCFKQDSREHHRSCRNVGEEAR